MSLVRTYGRPSSCPCGRRGGGAGVAFGDDTLGGTDAVMRLQAELNRFGQSAPVGLKFVAVPYKIDGILTNDQAAHAVAILQWRYQNALGQFPGESSTVFAKLQQVTSADAVKTPVNWVLGNLDDVTQLLQKFGDAKGIAPAGPISLAQIFNDPMSLTVLAVAAGVGLYVWHRSKRR